MKEYELTEEYRNILDRAKTNIKPLSKDEFKQFASLYKRVVSTINEYKNLWGCISHTNADYDEANFSRSEYYGFSDDFLDIEKTEHSNRIPIDFWRQYDADTDDYGYTNWVWDHDTININADLLCDQESIDRELDKIAKLFESDTVRIKMIKDQEAENEKRRLEQEKELERQKELKEREEYERLKKKFETENS